MGRTKDILINMWEEQLEKARIESGYPLWMLDEYSNAMPTPPSELEEPEDPRDYIDHDDLPF